MEKIQTHLNTIEQWKTELVSNTIKNDTTTRTAHLHFRRKIK
jgi:hypothetical protein